MKKFLAGLLTLAMAMSMLTMTAFAAPDTNETTSDYAIDFNKKGSITIHKYVKDESGSVPGTGLPIEGDSIPGGKVPLPGVTFTIYQVENKDYIEKLYSGEESVAELPRESKEIQTKYKINFSAVDNRWVLASNSGLTALDEVTTNESGMAEFKNLEVGIYLVLETKSPNAVSKPADPFLVSVPMTVTEAGKDRWLYDVHAYPKNETSTSGEIRLCKVGKPAGTAEVDIAGNRLAGAKFVLQRCTEGAGSYGSKWETVTRKMNANFEDGKGDLIGDANGVLTTDQDGYITVDGLSSGLYRFVEVSTVGGYIENGAAGYQFEIKGDKCIWSGQYALDGGSSFPTWFMPDENSTEINDHTKPWTAEASGAYDERTNAVPMIINEKPDLDKKVAPEGIPENWGKDAQYSVGDKIPYQIKVTMPSEVAMYGLAEFNVIDTPTNLIDDINSIKITPDTLEYGTHFTTEALEDGGFKITFLTKNNWGDLGNLMDFADQVITIEYEAVLQDTAVTTTAGNPNTAKLEYTNNIKPNQYYDPYNPNKEDTPGKNVIEDKTVVYTFQIDVEKVDGDNKPLGAGVMFELYKLVDTDKESGVLSADEAQAKGLPKAPLGKAYKQIPNPEGNAEDGYAFVTDQDSQISAEGLGNGDYWLVETKTLEGYNLLAEPVPVNLNIQAETSTTTSNEYEKNDDGTWTLVKTTFNSSQTKFKNNGTGNAAIGHATQVVINRRGFTLPATGGMGTFIFTFVGIAMMAAAVILFITSKKKESNF